MELSAPPSVVQALLVLPHLLCFPDPMVSDIAHTIPNSMCGGRVYTASLQVQQHGSQKLVQVIALRFIIAPDALAFFEDGNIQVVQRQFLAFACTVAMDAGSGAFSAHEQAGEDSSEFLP